MSHGGGRGARLTADGYPLRSAQRLTDYGASAVNTSSGMATRRAESGCDL